MKSFALKKSRGFTPPSPFSLLLNLVVGVHIQQLSDMDPIFPSISSIIPEGLTIKSNGTGDLEE